VRAGVAEPPTPSQQCHPGSGRTAVALRLTDSELCNSLQVGAPGNTFITQ
jgi:hypothetical protein